EFADAPPTVGPSFFGAFWYCLRRPFDFKSRANRTEYFGWLAGTFVALFALGFVAGLGTLVPFAWARATKGIPFVFLGAGLTFGLAASVPDAAVWTRRLRDRNVGASWKTALGGYVAVLAAAGGVAFCVSLLDSRDFAPNETTSVVLIAAMATAFFFSDVVAGRLGNVDLGGRICRRDADNDARASGEDGGNDFYRMRRRNVGIFNPRFDGPSRRDAGPEPFRRGASNAERGGASRTGAKHGRRVKRRKRNGLNGENFFCEKLDFPSAAR
ncbi:MAG: DUF805 domain-containing protein, partial [Thermoguttaceae bacterium]|nr:DUF805 domain-containing protein [Thermoguttaceae bacterium]